MVINSLLRHISETDTAGRRGVGLELAFIVLCVLVFIPNQRNFDPNVRPVGLELSYLVNSGIIAAQVHADSGTIPLWNPYMGEGEPIFESPFSFLFNPLMTLPFFVAEPMQAVKIGFLLHIFVAAFGGWLLGYVLDFTRGGRILLALLMVGNGSIVGAYSEGFYQMGIAQTYVPLIYAGLWGTLYRRGRGWIVLLVLGAVLLVFAGTYWYVLPTMIGAIVITLFALIRRDNRTRLRIFARVLWAGVLTGGIVMVRVLPQIIHTSYIEHPDEFERFGARPPVDILQLVRQYFAPNLGNGLVGNPIYFHYVVSPVALIVLVAVLVWLYRRGYRPVVNWRLVIPALMLIVFFTFWAQGASVPVRRVYEQLPFLQEWRILGRMMAAATPLIAVLVAMMFDHVLRGRRILPDSAPELAEKIRQFLQAHPVSEKDDFTTRMLARGRRVSVTWAAHGYLILRVGVVCLGVWMSVNVLANYNRITGVQPMYEVTRAPLTQLRIDHPNDFLSVETGGFFYYLPLYEIGARAAFGNPDYRPRGITPTIANRDTMDYMAEYALDFKDDQHDIVIGMGYHVLIVESDTAQSVLWESEDVPTYSYTIDPSLIDGRIRPVTRDITESVTHFQHYYDRVRLSVPPATENRVLVITETAYPGWQVTMNGVPAQLESVGELLGVRLPIQNADAPPNIVEFRYVPVWLFRGAWISLLSLLVFVLYAARLDVGINRLFSSE